jgi:hypothetical protein
MKKRTLFASFGTVSTPSPIASTVIMAASRPVLTFSLWQVEALHILVGMGLGTATSSTGKTCSFLLYILLYNTRAILYSNMPPLLIKKIFKTLSIYLWHFGLLSSAFSKIIVCSDESQNRVLIWTYNRQLDIFGVVVTGDNCSAVSTTPVINLSPVSTTPTIHDKD